MAKRPEAEETIDTAFHFLHHLQLEGWGVEKVEFDVEYGKPDRHAKQVPVKATVVVKLKPSHP